ncbi:hypothetical protein BU16DRAFT_609515, partial [Lophium mytilinum]
MGLERMQDKMEQWLQAPDPSTNYNKALQQRHEGSGSWLLESSNFAKWKTQRNSFLWLFGIPGCGKTILSSTVIRHIEEVKSSKSLLYFYFDFNDTNKQTLGNMVRSFISQLYYKWEDTRTQLESLFAACSDGRDQPTCEKLCKTLLDMLQLVDEVWIVLDALDECSTRSGNPTEGLLSWITGLRNPEHGNVHLIVTSRLEEDIKSEICEWVHKDNLMPLRGDSITADIRAYVRTRIREDKGLKRWRSRPEVQNDMETRLMEKADGMFRWAACQVDALVECLDYDDLQDALESLPDTLDETYARILKAIPPRHKPKAIRILQFLSFSERPLRIKELVDAIAVHPKAEPHFDCKWRMPNPQEIARYCSSLVAVVTTKARRKNEDDEDEKDRENLELRLAHFSVKDYLTSTRVQGNFAQAFQEAAARSSIATVCVAYLLDMDQTLSMHELI